MSNDANDTDALLRRAAGGDSAALADLFSCYRRRLRQMVRLRLDRRLQGRVDPSDVLQEAYSAKKAVELAPKEGNFWYTLGVAHYRAEDWPTAIETLHQSMELRPDGDAFDYFFLAMAHWQLGNLTEAGVWHRRALAWLEKNRDYLKRDVEHAEELRRFGAEAAVLLGIETK